MLKAPLLHFELDDPTSPDVALLIRELDGYLAELYPSGNIRHMTAEELSQPNVSFLTARVDGTPVACGAFVAHEDYVEVKRMYVLPACRGLGLGKQLLEALEVEVARSGGRILRLETGTAQTEALELYARAGYRRCPPFGEHQSNPRSICMEKHLA
jgi:putative acetyltransferase